MKAGRCPACGTRSRPNPVPWLVLPALLGLGAVIFLRTVGRDYGLGPSVLIVTLPFAAFLLVLRQFTLAWSEVDEATCRGCGRALPSGPGRGS